MNEDSTADKANVAPLTTKERGQLLGQIEVRLGKTIEASRWQALVVVAVGLVLAAWGLASTHYLFAVAGLIMALFMAYIAATSGSRKEIGRRAFVTLRDAPERITRIGLIAVKNPRTGMVRTHELVVAEGRDVLLVDAGTEGPRLWRLLQRHCPHARNEVA